MKSRLFRSLFSVDNISPRSQRSNADLQFEKCEPRQMLSTTWQAGSLNYGVASANNAQGLGYMMFSEESALTRFQGNNTNNAEHFVPVRFRNDGQWQYNNNRNWVNFTTRSNDVLVAHLNFSLNTATSLENVNTRVAGVQAGYDDGDVIVKAGIWNGLDRPEEFTVSGTSFTTYTSGDDTISAGSLGRGVAVEDLAIGNGLLMYTEQLFNERFPFTNVNQAEHFVAVRLAVDGSWEFSNNREWIPFETVESDLIVAELDFDEDSFRLWKGIKFRVQQGDGDSIDGGFVEGDITIAGGQWNGNPDIGEFQIFGSYLRRYDKDSLAFSESSLSSGVAIADDATGAGFLLHSSQDVSERFENIDPNNATHFIAVRHDGVNWQYNDDQAWRSFEPVRSDFLVATIDFDSDRIVSLASSASEIQGVTVGFLEGDLTFTANHWAGLPDVGEVQVRGTVLTPWVRESVGDLGRGIWIHDQAAGPGYILHSQQPVQDRFDWVNAKSAQHFIAVQRDGLNWHYSNGLKWVSFTPAASDRLMSRISFGNESQTIFPLSSQRVVEGIMANYEYGDLQLIPNTWNGRPFPGRVSVTGTHFLTEPGIRESAFGSPLNDIGNGLSSYAEAFGGKLPSHAIYSTESEPLLSWRVSILPFIGHAELYNKFDKTAAWDSPDNLALLDEMPSIFANPELTFRNKTVYQVLNSETSAFPLSADADVRISTIGETVLVAEVDVDRAVEWTRPLDLVFSDDAPLDGLGDGFAEQFDVLVSNRSASSFRYPGTMILSVSAIEDAENFAMLVDRGGELADMDTIEPFSTVQENFRRIGLAVSNFHSTTNRLPAWAHGEEQPLLSWRVMILPYLGHGDLYQQFNLTEAWNGPTNSLLMDKMPSVYASPGLPSGITKVFGLGGVNNETVFPLDRSRVTLESIADGADRTAMIVESSSAGVWSQPADIAFDASSPREYWGNSRQHGTNVIMASGATVFVGNDVAEEDVVNLVVANDGQEVDFANYAPYADPSLNLRAAAIAAHNFHDSYRRLPAYAWFEEPFDGGQPLLSWRVSLLPFLGYNELYERFNLNEAWDSANNIALLPLIPREFSHALVSGEGMTNFRAVVGEAGDPTNYRTVFASDARKTTLESIFDGTSNTALFVEANADYAVEWTRPMGLAYNDANPWQGMGAIEGGGFNVAMADASARFVSNQITAQQLRDLLLMNNGA